MPASPHVNSGHSSKTWRRFAPVSTQILIVGKWAYKSWRRERERKEDREGRRSRVLMNAAWA